MTQSEFEAIALQLRKKVRATIVRMLSSADAADDAASDVMLRLWALHDQLNDDSHAFKLALVIARNVSIDMARRQKRSYALFADAEKLPTEVNTNIFIKIVIIIYMLKIVKD